MKKHLTFAVATLLLAACSNDNGSLADGGLTEIRLSSGIEVQQTDTRAETAIQGAQFGVGEQVAVFIHENVTGEQSPTVTYEQPLVYTAGENGALSTNQQPYFPASGRGVNIYALYPATVRANASFSVEADQSEETSYKASDLMYGLPAQGNPVRATQDAISLQFTHLLSKVTVTLVPGVGRPDLDGAVVKLIGVKPSTKLAATSSGVALTPATGTAQDITVMTAAAGALSGSAIVPPQTLQTSFIEVTLKDGKVFRSAQFKGDGDQLLSEITLQGGQENKYTITLNLDKEALEVTSSIVEWKYDEFDDIYFGTI